MSTSMSTFELMRCRRQLVTLVRSCNITVMNYSLCPIYTARRHDKTVLSVSCPVCRCELDDCSERVQTSNFLLATVLSCRESNSHRRSGRDTDETVLSCLAWRCELALSLIAYQLSQILDMRTVHAISYSANLFKCTLYAIHHFESHLQSSYRKSLVGYCQSHIRVNGQNDNTSWTVQHNNA